MRKLIEYFKEYYSDNSGTKRSDSSTMFKSYCRAANEKPETKEWISSINHSGWKEIRHEP